MPSIHKSGSVSSAQSGHEAKPVQPGSNGSAGMRKVNSHPHSTAETPRQQSLNEAPKDLLEGVQSLQGRRLVGSSAEDQLGQLISSNDLIESYKLRAKDLYFDASLRSLKDLKNFVARIDPEIKPQKIAKVFKKSLLVVQNKLKDMDGANASDLNITIDTPLHGKVQLIPFNLEKIEPGQLMELLDIALQLTEDAVHKWRDHPDYPALREKYTQNILQHDSQIGNLLTGIHPDNEEIFKKRIDLLQFPKIQILHGSDKKVIIENTAKRKSSAEPLKQSKQTVVKEDRMMDEAVQLYQRHSELDDPADYVKKQKALATELLKYQRVAKAPSAEPESSELPGELVLPDDGVSLFRGILTLVYEDKDWINASQEDIEAAINSEDVAQSIKFAIEEVLNTYLEFEPVTDAQRTIANSLRERFASGEAVSSIFDYAFAQGEFSHNSVDDLAEALGIESKLTDEANDPYVLELKILAKMLYKGVLAEFNIPESTGQKPGLRRQNGRYILMGDEDFFTTDV